MSTLVNKSTILSDASEKKSTAETLELNAGYSDIPDVSGVDLEDPIDQDDSGVAARIELTKVRARNGRHFSSLAEFIELLSSLGLDGPLHFLNQNVRTSGTLIGRGSQFDVFKKHQEGIGQVEVWKRVKWPRIPDKQKDMLPEYRKGLRHLEAECLALSDPRLRNHRNIVRLLGWALDYDDRKTGIPVLRVECALCPLSTLLQGKMKSVDAAAFDISDWRLRYQLALDTAAGLAAIHGCNIVHGDLKPENILIFRQDSPTASYIAKIGDFGVALDLLDRNLEPNYYIGTPAWTGPEVDMGIDAYRRSFGAFDPWHFKLFDSFSFGMLLMALFFTEAGQALDWRNQQKHSPQKTIVDIAMSFISEVSDSQIGIISIIRSVIAKCLQLTPQYRPLPTQDILQSSSASYKEWLSLTHQVDRIETEPGTKDFAFNRGPGYWATLDDDVAKELAKQHTSEKHSDDFPPFSGSTLLGLAQKFSKLMNADSSDKIFDFILCAAEKGHVPAQAICERIFEARNKSILIDQSELKSWCKRSILSGYLFHDQKYFDHNCEKELRLSFRRRGGYCTDPFTRNRMLVNLVCDAAKWSMHIESIFEDLTVDTNGNSYLHLCAAFGNKKSLDVLLRHPYLSKAKLNDNKEWPLYKACQAGNLEALCVLVEAGHRIQAVYGTPCEAHWLFAFDEDQIDDAVKLLIKAGVDVNQSIVPIRGVNRSTSFSSHFPFLWPLGTPLHWAAFAQNKKAVSSLIEHGAFVDPPLGEDSRFETPLMQACCRGDDSMVSLLLKLGANPSIKDQNGNNLLHLLSLKSKGQHCPSDKLQTWVRHGNWRSSLERRVSIVTQLVDCGVELEQRSTSYGHTPLLQASVDVVFRDEIVAFALVLCGADVQALSSSDNRTALHACASRDMESLIYPGAYFPLLEAVARRTPDVNFLGGVYEESALHGAARAGGDAEQLRETIKLLNRESNGGLNINLFDGCGETPLMRAVTTSADIKELKAKLQVLLDAGAHPRYTNDYAENVMTKLMRNDRLLDNESSELISMLTSNQYFDKPQLADFINSTDSSVLAIACVEGKMNTMKKLLDLGMVKRINEPMNSRRIKGLTALSHAFYGAKTARRTYVSELSYYHTEEASKRAQADGSLYSSNNYGKNISGQAGSKRQEERYWALPEILRFLQSLNAVRTPISRSEWELEPSFEDAFGLSEYGMLEEERPHQLHWKPLYDLELLGEGWEALCLEKIMDWYSDEELVIPPVTLFYRWPQVVAVRTPTEGNWYKALNGGTDLVEVEMVDARVNSIRDWHTKKATKRKTDHIPRDT